MNTPVSAPKATPDGLSAFPAGGRISMVLATLLLTLLGLSNYPLFHALAELICVVAGMATFLVIWNARAYAEHAFFLILGLAFLAAGGFDALHVLDSAGLIRLPLPPSAIVVTWAAGRLAFAISLCCGSWWLRRRAVSLATVFTLVVGSNVVLSLAFAAYALWRPSFGAMDFLTPGTPLVRLFPALLLAAASCGLVRHRDQLAPPVVRLLLAAFVCLTVSQTAFVCPSGSLWPQLLGHVAKVLGYALSCQAIVVTGISRPYDLLFREIGLREQDLNNRLVRLNAQARAIFELNKLDALESGEFKSFAATLLARAATVLGVARTSVWVLSPDRERLLCLLGDGSGRGDAGVELYRSDFPDYFEAIDHERVIVAENAATSPLTRDLAVTFLKEREVTSLLDAPFRFSGRLAGVLSLQHVGVLRRFPDDERAFAGSLADTLSLALETAERRRAARELAESEQRLRLLLDAMPDPVCFKDAAGRWIVANAALLHTFGLDDVDWKGLTDAALAERAKGDGQALAAAAATDAGTWATPNPNLFGVSMTDTQDRTRHFDVIKAPLFYEDGRPKGLVALYRDITAYRDALSRLRETNQELEAIYNETSDGLIITDVGNQAVIRVNAAACRMFGYDAWQLTALSPWDLHPLEDRAGSIRLFGEIAADRLHLLEGIPCRRKNGELFYTDIAAQPITYGGRPAILGFYRDITERKAAQEALKTSEARFRKVFNSTYDAILLHDEHGTILDCNEKMLELYGVRRDEATTLSLEHDYAAPDNPPGKQAEYWRDVMAGEDRFFEWKARRPHDGSSFYVEVYLRRLRLADRNVILSNVRDVTERKRVQAALAARQEEISALNRDLARRVREETEKNRQKDILLVNQTRLAAMGEMIGNIAHQWRQPLNALSILLANMRFEYETVCTEDIQALLNAHQQADAILRRMSTTIDDFRNFFKPDKQRAPFRVVDAISDALVLIEASLTQHGVAVRFVARHNPRVLGFRGEFSQVVLNLLSNAKDAILAARPSGGGCIAIRVMTRLGQAVIHVADNGGGIPDAIMERIFDPYFTTKSDHGGTGLGLYMSKTIVEDHLHGALAATNFREGTRLTIRIPLERFKDATPARPLQTALQPSGR